MKLPVDSDTARVKFTRLLTFCECGGIKMSPGARWTCSITKIPLGRALHVR